jgi:hypothetical protein
LIWYPGDRKHIVIQLSVNCLTDLPRACYQLAHECIHLLAPTGRQNANNLEEGLATLFSEDYATCEFTPDDILDTTSVNQEDAYYLCQPLAHDAGEQIAAQGA